MARSKFIKYQEKIEEFKNLQKEVLPERKEEISNIICENNGIFLDNRVIAGFALFASSRDNKNHPILKEFIELGKNKTPSKRSSNKKTQADHLQNKISGDAGEAKKSNG